MGSANSPNGFDKTNGQASWRKHATLFLTGQTVSLFGSSLVQYAIIWYVTLETQSGVMMMISTLFAFLPQILVSLFAGVWADRYSRKKLIILSDSMIALSTLVLAIIYMLGYGQLWMIFIASGIRSLGAGIQMPAVSSMIPQLVPNEKLMRVNGIYGSIQSLMLLVSPMVSGAMLGTTSLEAIFFVDVVTAAIGIGLLSRLPYRFQKKSETMQEGYFSELQEGFRYIAAHPLVKRMLVFFGVFMFLVVPAAFLSPLFVAREYGAEVWRQTANEMLFSGGSVLGGVIVAAWGWLTKNRLATITFSCMIFGVLTVMMGLATNFWVYLVLIFITGMTLPAFQSVSTVLLQEKVEPDKHGRVFSFMQLVSTVAMPAGMLLFGPIADAIPIAYLLIVTGVLLGILGVGAYLNKAFHIAAR